MSMTRQMSVSKETTKVDNMSMTRQMIVSKETTKVDNMSMTRQMSVDGNNKSGQYEYD